jgi:hypothetical protein
VPTYPAATIPNNQAGPTVTQFAGMLESVIAGQSAPAKAQFLLPNSKNLTGASISYEIVDAEGTVYSFGVGANLRVIPNITGQNQVVADATITVPSDTPANDVGTKYALRWILTLASGETIHTQEIFTVRPATQRLMPGVEDSVELYGDTTTLNIVLDKVYSAVQWSLYKDNTLLIPNTDANNVATPIESPDGYQYSGLLDSALTSGLEPRLEPYHVRWRYWDGPTPVNTGSDMGQVFFVTASIIGAAKDVFLTVAKAYQNVGITPNAQFIVPEILSFLRQGMDRFNGVQVLTNFRMTNATGPVRDGWINYSIVAALRAQYLAEGNKSFDFSSQAVTLNVDKTQYFEGLASSIESRLDNQIPNIKHALVKYGLNGGDGNTNVGARMGHIGAVGIALSPATNIRNIRLNMGNFGALGIFP